MKQGWLFIALPAAAGMAVLVGVLLFTGSAALPDFYRAELAAVEASALIGCLVGAATFARGEYLRRAWQLLASCFLLILVGDLTLTTGPFSDRPWTGLANGILTVVANLGQISGTFMLARALRVAGIAMPSSRGRTLVYAGALALALGAAGTPAYMEIRHVARGEVEHLMFFASCLGDIVSFSLIAPMLLSALALRGGLLSWPFALLTGSLVSWLCFDAVVTLGPLTAWDAPNVKLCFEVLRALACTLAGAAGLAQRLAARVAAGQSDEPSLKAA